MKLQQYEIDHLAAIRPYLPECTVLLKSNGDFPLEKAGEIAAYGSGVRHTLKGGTGSGEVNSRFFVNVETGLERSGFTVTSKDWLNAYDTEIEKAKERFVKEIKAAAKAHHTSAVVEGMGKVMAEPDYTIPYEIHGDTAIYVLSRICGEGNDREPVKGDLLLTDTEVRDILTLRSVYKKFMLVLNVGGPVDLTPVLAVENILILSQLGVDTGLVLARVLLGKMNPSGKLATTWSAWEDYPTVGEFGGRDETRYKEGIYVGYRYFDSVGKKAMFPFGFGRSFTTFSMENIVPALENDTVTVAAEVENTGAFSGKETLEVYVSAPEGKLDQPYQKLAAFSKTKELMPGEKETVCASFRLADIASYDAEQAAWVLEAGDYILRAGTSSVDTCVCGRVRLAETVVVKKVKHALGTPDFEDWRPETVPAEEPGEEPVLIADPAVIATECVDYTAEEEIDPRFAEMTDEELALMNIGAFSEKGGLVNVIGSSATRVCGAAGETVTRFEDRGIPVIVMADGPAGVRITKEYKTDGKNNYTENPMPESMAMFLPKVVTILAGALRKKPPKDAKTVTQYCTAIPIGTAVAQSWNTAFAELCGDIVGDEMELFGVQLWLAPALNIHRSILCGRNFEYYSEDPLITGKMAAAITNGVQKHPGRGTTIKHFAANNQEFNRYQNNSQVSERAMREIYLKGFEICVKESQPHALMTSYNLLNGVHTSERRDLTEDILRREFGFKGIVMTDWVVSMLRNKEAAYDFPHADRVAAAGGDLFMPGGKKDYEEILAGLRSGTLSRKQLEINATRVYRMAENLCRK